MPAPALHIISLEWFSFVWHSRTIHLKLPPPINIYILYIASNQIACAVLTHIENKKIVQINREIHKFRVK